ncbi:hypothetical protein ACWE42_24805 [Sutcliffiella cohnii]
MKLKTIIKYIFFIFIIAVILHFLDFKEGGRWFSSTQITNIPDIKHEEYEVDVVFTKGERENVLEQLKLQHHYLQKNVAIHPEQYRDLITSDGWKELKSTIHWLKTFGFESGRVLNDMETAEALIHLVERDGDSLSLTYLSRIFNDIHFYLVDSNNQEVWGITHAYGSNREIRRLNKYIEKNY